MKEKILEVTRQLMREKPFNQITLNLIAEEIGISRQSVYRHVGNKSALRRLVEGEVEKDHETIPTTKEEILASAYKIFAEFGYNEATLDQVALDARYSKGAIYSNFKSKSELFLALLDSRLNQQMKTLPIQVKSIFKSNEPLNAFTKLVECQLAYLQSDPNWSRMFMEFLTNSRNQEIEKKLNESYRSLTQQLNTVIVQLQEEEIISVALDPSIVSSFITSLFDGFAMTSIIYQEQLKPKEWSEQIASILMHGLTTNDKN